MREKEAAIIVAGGKGLRLPGDTPKQFLPIGGLPVIMHTINAFYAYDPSIEIILVLPTSDFPRWEELCRRYAFHKPLRLVSGGQTRYHSVKNGLAHVVGPGIVAVHDGVRPLITTVIIARSFEVARKSGSAVTAVSLKESIREIFDTSVDPASDPDLTVIEGKSGDGFRHQSSKALDRSRYRLMQTPQTFDIALLQSAYSASQDDSVTDDASVMEMAGHAITLVEGSYENLKITTPEDLVVAEAILKSRTKST